MPTTITPSESALALHRSALIFDGHCDTLGAVTEGKRRLGERSEKGHVDLLRLLQGGVTAQVFACWVGGAKARRPLLRFLRMADALFREISENQGHLTLARAADDVVAAKRDGRVAAVLSLEGGEPLLGDLAVLRVLHRLGLRNLGLVWGGRNRLGSAVFGEGIDDEGLSKFGLAVVREAQRIGVMVDVSHLNEAGFWDVMRATQGPVIASHSNARVLYDHPRNLRDEQLRAIAETGGVVGATFTFLRADPSQGSLNDVLDHIAHMAEVMGVEHVGLGSDYDGIRQTPQGLEDVSRLPNLTQGLLDRGFTESEVRQVLGENFLRAFRAALTRLPVRWTDGHAPLFSQRDTP